VKNSRLPGFSWFLLGLIFLSMVVGALVFNHLPEKVPMHWNLRGEVDGYSGRWVGAFGIPLMTLGVYILMILVPRIDPKRSNYEKFAGAYNIFVTVLVLFLIALYSVVLLSAFGYNLDVGILVRIGVGVMFVVMGNYLTQVRHNYFFGIRTPWTLASESVWRKTHRLGGVLFVVAGIITLLSIFLGSVAGFILTIGSLLVVTIISAVYSYIIFKVEGHFKT
jgi:uncharacterized membrane protein